MLYHVMLNVNCDALGLATDGGVTIRTPDGDLLVMETLSWGHWAIIPTAASLLARRADELLVSLPTQLQLPATAD